MRPWRRARIDCEMNPSGLAASCLAAGGRADNLWELLVCSAAMVGVLLVLATGILWVRRGVLGRNRPAGTNRQMEQIEALRRQGQLSKAEYKAARRSALGLSDRAGQAGESKAGALPGPGGPDEDAKT